MKKLYILLITIFITTTTLSQSCLPEGITLSTQTQIDSFHVNYPGCNEIEGDLTIKSVYSGDVINDLTGLVNITAIWGYLRISLNYYLVSFNGLENITTIGGDLRISSNFDISNLAGLNNISTVGGLYINNNTILSDLTALSNLSSIGGGNLIVNENPQLTDLIGLDNIDAGSILDLGIYNNALLSVCEIQSVCDYLLAPNGSVTIAFNSGNCNSPTEVANSCGNELACLPYGNYLFLSQLEIDNFQSDFPDCTDLNGDVFIYGNDIISLAGLNVVTSIGELHISENPLLPDLTGLEQLTTINGGFWIDNNPLFTNLIGLVNLSSIGGSLNLSENNALINLSGLENLSSIGGGLSVGWNPNLFNLTALENITTIGGHISIRGNNSLNSLSGLNNLTSIEEYLVIENNNSITSLAGLNNLNSIGEYFKIDNNDGLINLVGLNNLFSVGVYFMVTNNSSLESLVGLDNFDGGTIIAVLIANNPSLATCEINCICDWLADPNGNVTIEDNASGCNTTEEVIMACTVEFPEIHAKSFSIYPNPATNEVFISSYTNSIINEVNIYNQLGQNVLHQQGHNNAIDVSMLQPGIYIIELVAGESLIRRKLMME